MRETTDLPSRGLYLREGVHHRVEHDGHPVVQEGLSEEEEVEVGVDANLLEDGEDGHRVHGRDERGEHQDLGHAQVVHADEHVSRKRFIKFFKGEQ